MSVIGTAAAAVAIFTGNPQFAALAYTIGAGVESAINPPEIVNTGPRLDELRTQMSTYGAPIPVEFGVNRHAGTIIWPKLLDAVEHRSETTESSKGGSDTTTVGFTYTLSCAVLVCEGPIAGITRIWANKKIVYDVSPGVVTTQDPAIGSVRFYLGTETQAADPLITATDGASPAYLGFAYVVFEDYDVTDLGGRPPQWEFEVLTETSFSAPVYLGLGGKTVVYGDEVWSVTGTNVYVYNRVTGALITTIALPSDGSSITVGNGQIWIGHSESGSVYGICATPIDPLTYSAGVSTDFGYAGAVSKLGTVVWNAAGSYLYGFINNGIGSGALKYPSEEASAITVPHWVYHSLEMPDINRIALAGYGNWLVIADTTTDLTVATITNTAWSGTAQQHRLAYDASRNCVYWIEVGSAGVYKVDLTSYVLTLLIATGVNVDSLFFSDTTDAIYIDNGADLEVYNPDTGALTSSLAGGGVLAGLARGNTADAGAAYFVSEQTTIPGGLWKVPYGLAPGQVLLSTIVSDLCVRAGLATSDIDVTQLTDLVDGYIVPRQMTARAALEPLQQAYFFDAVESDDKIKFVKRGGAIAATIPLAERAAHESGQDTPDHLSILRSFELELPAECDVEYPDLNADHLIGNQYERRITKDTKQKINLQLPIVMPASKAKQIARVLLYQAWLNQSYRWSTSRKYAWLEPTDLVQLPTALATYAARITSKRELPGGVIEWEGQTEDAAVYTQSGSGAATLGYLPQTIFVPDATVLALLDIPLMRDEDDNGGYYVAMGGVL